MGKRTKKPRSRDTKVTSHERDFISVTEVEERYFPKMSRRQREDQPLDIETRRKAEDALEDIRSGIVASTPKATARIRGVREKSAGE